MYLILQLKQVGTLYIELRTLKKKKKELYKIYDKNVKYIHFEFTCSVACA